jgi:hypothetical protein
MNRDTARLQAAYHLSMARTALLDLAATNPAIAAALQGIDEAERQLRQAAISPTTSDNTGGTR